MVTIFKVILICLGLTLQAKVEGPAQDPWGGALAVTAAAGKEAYPVGGTVDIHLKVTNTSKTDQKIGVWSCSWYENISCSEKSLKMQVWACDENGTETIVLKPGESWEKDVKLDVAKDAQGGKVAFKMGFTACETKTTLWSDEVKVLIEAAGN